MTEQKYYLCTLLRSQNTYDSTAMNCNPVEYIIELLPEKVALINSIEITKEHYEKIVSALNE